MKRQLPIYPIDGTDFLVDIDRQELRQANRPDNVISFVKDTTDMSHYYILPYDRREKNYPHTVYTGQEVIEITLPNLTVLDPEGMAEKFGYTVEQLKGKDDFDIFINLEGVAERKAGTLPILWIDGYDFLVDINKNELRPRDALSAPIPLPKFNFGDGGHSYSAYYHILERALVDIDLKMMELPKDVQQIRIPNVVFLDPVGVAHQYGIDENFLLRRYPIHPDMKAELIPLERTHLQNLTRSNQLYRSAQLHKAKLEKEAQTRRTRPKL